MPGKFLLFRTVLAVVLVAAVLACGGCIKPKIVLFPGVGDPLQESTLQGEGKEKILVVPVNGFISDGEGGLPLRPRPGMVQEIVAHLKKAEKDEDVKALVLKIDSPGGSVTASDMLYHEIMGFKERTGAKVVAAMMGVAASGGYYVSLPADFIMAHPTTITGSIGVVFLRPILTGIMDKIGIEVEVSKSGKNKDMGSPFRQPTGEEEQMAREMIDNLAGRFVRLVDTHRKLSEEAKADMATGRVYPADKALRLGLVDRIGYLDDAIRKAGEMAGLPEDAKVVVYRRNEYPNDNIYNTSASAGAPTGPQLNLVDVGLADYIPPLRSGFYYMWMPGRAD